MELPKNIYVATTPVNLHLSFDRLAGIVRDQLGADPRAEALYLFPNRRGTHVKILWHDGTGYWVLYKRLDRGTFRIPMPIPAGATHVTVMPRRIRSSSRRLTGPGCEQLVAARAGSFRADLHSGI